MKKILKYISLIGLSSFILTGNVKAYTVNVEHSGHSTNFGYTTQTQTISGGACDGVPIYCIEKGATNVQNFYGCEAIYVGNSAYAQVSNEIQDHDTREYLFRVIAKNFGHAATYKNGKVINNYDSIQNYTNWLPSKGLNDLLIKLNSYVTSDINASLSRDNFTYSITSNDGNNATVVMELTTDVPNLESRFTVTDKAKIISRSYANGKYIITATTPIERCKGGNFKLVLNSDVSITAGTNEVYLFKCKDPRQSYIVPITKQGCNINELTNKGAVGNEYEVSVPDPECNCKGTTTMNGQCDTKGVVKDLENDENLKSCIKQGGFAEYCSTNLEKTTDTKKNTTRPILSKTKNSNTNVTLSNNKYCKVYCLENIEYDLPGEIDTQNGSYFKLKRDWNKKDNSGSNMKITGTRTCYTSEIKRETFISDVKALEEQIKNSWNDYQFNKKKKEIIANKDAYKKTGTKSCPYSTTVNKKDAKGNDIKNADGTVQTETQNASKSNTYTYYEAHEQYDYEKGNSAGDGSWNTNVGKHDIEVKWGDNPTCNSDGSITEDTTEPTVVLDKKYETLLTQLSELINQYKSCTEWTNNYCFDPKINFSYDEVYNKDVSGEVKKTIINLEPTKKYYTSVNDSYTAGTEVNGAKTNINYIYADDTNCNTQTSNIDLTTIYMKEEVKKVATYKDAVKEVYTYHPYGTIVTDKSKVEKQENLKSLGYVFPIALQHDPDTGVYNYYLSISNIGVGGNDAVCNNDTYTDKIMGKSCSIFNTKNEVTAGKEYVCQYKTKSCPDCEVECVCPDNSKNCYVENKICKFKECPTCKVECVGCIWNNGDTTVSYKTISLDDVYVDDSQKGQNWSDDAVQEIESKGQEIYSNTPVFEIDLTPTLTSKIRAYNAENKDYSNDTLSCSANNSSNSYYCTSSFLKDFLSQQHANYKDFDRK